MNTTQHTSGLGPNQLAWLRSNLKAFRELEEAQLMVRQDAHRAAVMAGLIEQEAA
jgi:hypothetical protein